MRAWSTLGVIPLTSALCACLPTDTRPPPGRLLLTASAPIVQSTELPSIDTVDGFHITISKLLVVMGHAQMVGDGCTAYSDAYYARLLNLLVPGPQKVNELFGLGTCELDFALSSPFEEPVLGAHISAEDLALMSPKEGWVQADTRYFEGGSVGYSFYVEGQATNGAVTKNIAWGFTEHVQYLRCVDAKGQGFRLEADDVLKPNIVVDVAALFDDASSETQITPRFQPLADADTNPQSGNNDGEVTFAELREVELSSVSNGSNYRVVGRNAPSVSTLGDFVHSVNFRLKVPVHVDDRTCAVPF